MHEDGWLKKYGPFVEVTFYKVSHVS